MNHALYSQGFAPAHHPPSELADFMASPVWQRLACGCHRLEPAGPLRRRGRVRPGGAEIELVALPRIEIVPASPASPEGVRRDWLRAAVTQLVNDGECLALRRQLQTDVPCHRLLYEEGRLAVWVAEPRQFGSIWLWRTGSRGHVAWLCERARRRRMSWTPGAGLCTGLRQIGAEENEVYAELGLRFVPPQSREPGQCEAGQFDLREEEGNRR